MWKFLRSLRNRSADKDRPLPYVDPLRAVRHPFQVYMLALCVVAGAPYLFGYATAEAIERELPVLLAAAWGVTLLFGAAVALTGSYWRGSIANALTMERFGLSLTGGAGLVYGLCIVGAKSLLAPVLLVGVYVGYFLLRVPVSTTRWSPKRAKTIADMLTITGVLFIIGNLGVLMLTPALAVLLGAFVILGFGMSCLTRARDIGQIFHRANDPSNSAPVLRENQKYVGG